MAPIETDASAPEASTSAKTPVAGSALPASAARHASPPADSKDATLSAALSAFAAAAEAFKHELHLFGHAGKYEWMNRRLILLRNAVIAFGVVITAMVIVVMLFREAYRETLSIAAFSVPEKLAERGITGQVVAQSLFDELIKRRTTVTTLDAGELKGAWSEHRSDIAVPDTKFTLQPIFRYLRALTGKEIAVDGEMLIDGDEVTIKARVQGKPPRVVKGKLVEWEVSMGQLANYVYEVTQPVVLASYWGLTAKSDAEMEMLSALIRRMDGGEPRATPAVLSVAYYAYGLALERQEKHAEALFAWERARLYDPTFALPYFAAAAALINSDGAASEKLIKQTASLNIGKAARLNALVRRYIVARASSDCVQMRDLLREQERIGLDDPFATERQGAMYMVLCDFRQAKGVAILRNYATLHPDSSVAWYNLGLAEWIRAENSPSSPLRRREYLNAARNAFEAGVAADRNRREGFAHVNLGLVLSVLGEHDAALSAFHSGMDILRKETRADRGIRAVMHVNKGEFKEAEAIFRRNLADIANARPAEYRRLALVLAAMNRADEALEIMRAGQTRFPAYCPIYHRTGEIYIELGRDSEAVAEWEKGIAAIPKCDANYVSLAKALIEQKRFSEARKKT